MYLLLLERLERHVIAERQVAATMKAGGAKDVDVPTFEAERQRLDRALGQAERKYRDPEQQALIDALGLNDGG